MRKLAAWTLGLTAALGALYWWYAADSRMPADADFALDLAEMRRLADSLPGDKPGEIRYEKVTAFAFPGAMIVAGDAWAKQEMPVYAYQLVYPDHTAMIDAAMTRDLAKPDFMIPYFDEAAQHRVEAALERASFILITHEHSDHSGGVLQHPRLAALLPALRLTQVQLEHQQYMKPATVPTATFAGYQPLRYERMAAVAPGVVAVAAAGHTPGSQMVYVRQADGRELLFLGDVSWKRRNIAAQRERPRFVTEWLIGEDRHAVFGQLKTLHRLAGEAPGLKQVPGHDGEAIAELTAAGFLKAGFIQTGSP
ncbi:MBL fold metallo-hydrolase [Solimonas sp. K1W22B-7]|uniref:MBL fold metallo-hydrolase n=1 Tax=Solimonas sp. K1W22B-7 TaxID=2303331 RepID=UPI000E336C2A|nr:MBL fold metallo-hydrolase [Solimonas sp. K1W22B-7]AXQ28669.1 MBL fold metallo-hydrolase [Solimonas sp. K1W22B-7]